MPKTIAITPSWYWPAGTTRVTGIPPFGLHEMLVDRLERRQPDHLALVSGEERLSAAELAARVHGAAAAISAQVEPGACVALCAGTSADGVILLLAALAAGARVRLVPPDAGVALVAGAGRAQLALADAAGSGTAAATGLPVLGLADLQGGTGELGTGQLAPGDPAVAVPAAGGEHVAWHSHRSLLAAAVSIATFLDVDPGLPWLSAQPLASWQGLAGIGVALFSGCTLVLVDESEEVLAPVARESAGYAFMSLDQAVALTKEAKRAVKDVRGVLRLLLLSVPGPFDPDLRRRVGRLFECPALTLFGSPEAGPIFASHPSWYLDESVGIPITNAHVVPVDPRSGAPIQTLWELVESARVTVASPAAMVGYDVDGTVTEPVQGGRIETPTIASSDANGMIYLLPD